MLSSMPFRALTDTFHGLMMHRVEGNEEDKTRYLDNMRAIRAFEQFRNQVSHSLCSLIKTIPNRLLEPRYEPQRRGLTRRRSRSPSRQFPPR